MILYICVFVYVCVYIVCIYLVMILTFKSRYFLSFHLKDVFLYEVCMLFSLLFVCCLVDIACSHTAYVLIRVSYNGQVNGTKQSYAHLYVCVCAHLCGIFLGILFALLMCNVQTLLIDALLQD